MQTAKRPGLSDWIEKFTNKILDRYGMAQTDSGRNSLTLSACLIDLVKLPMYHGLGNLN